MLPPICSVAETSPGSVFWFFEPSAPVSADSPIERPTPMTALIAPARSPVAVKPAETAMAPPIDPAATMAEMNGMDQASTAKTASAAEGDSWMSACPWRQRMAGP